MTSNFNLVVEPWIPVLWTQGKAERVGMKMALERAGQIRQVAASNPMDNVALLRFLLAVLHWCKATLDSKARSELGAALGIPGDWLTSLGTADEPNEAFNLLGDRNRFYQDGDTPRNNRPIGDLLVEFPTETKIAHFRHVRDNEYGLCPACCALGIVRFSTFANAYGGGRYTSAVNGPSPAYAIHQGPTLLETLQLYWPANGVSGREPPWLNADPPSKEDLNMVTVHAWRSRRIWLDGPGGQGVCQYCGKGVALIRRLAFTGNWKPPFQTTGQQKKFWEADTQLLLVDRTPVADGEDESADSKGKQLAAARWTGSKGAAVKTTLGFPMPESRVAVHARFWRRALMARSGQATARAVGGRPMPITIAGPAANKGLYQDAAVLRLLRPSTGGCAARRLDAQDEAVKALNGVLRPGTRNPRRQHSNRMAALDALSASLEAELRRQFDSVNPGEAGQARHLDQLRERLVPIVELVVRCTTAASPLRQREAMERARAALESALKDITALAPGAASAGASQPGDAGAASKGRRVHKSMGGGA